MKVSISRKVMMIIALVMAFFIQINFLQWVPSLTCAPNFVLIVLFSFGFLRGSKAGMAAGLFCGILTDIFQGGPLGFYTLLFIYIGYLNGILKKHLTSGLILLPIILCTISELAYHLYVYLFGFLLHQQYPLSGYLDAIVIPEFLMTALASIIFYGFIMWIDRKLESREKKGEMRLV